MSHAIAVVAICAIVTIALRALPFVCFGGKCRDGQRKQHTKSQHKCGKFLEILHYAASFSFTAAIVKITVAALMFVTASLAETFAL